MAAFYGRLFGPGIAGAGMQVAGNWRGDALELAGADFSLRVSAAELAVDAAGFNAGQTRVSWHADSGEHAFFIDKPEHGERFRAAAPAALHPQLHSLCDGRRRIVPRFRTTLLAYGILLALPFIILAAFLLNTRSIAGWAARQVPPAYEIKLGQMMLAQTRARVRLLDSGPAHAALAQIGAQLSTGSRYSYQWFIADTADVNAFAAPGGIIVVNAGLIANTERAEELAGVLAHEVAHVEQRHALTAMFKRASLGVLLAVALGDWSGSAIGAWAADLTKLKFSRDAEMEADRFGLHRLVHAGMEPSHMANFFARLALKEDKPGVLSLLATHPSSQQRNESLRRQIDALPARSYQPLDFDWKAVRASLPAG